MSWQQWVLIAIFAGNGLACVASVGKPRAVITSADAVGTLLLEAVFIVLVVTS